MKVIGDNMLEIHKIKDIETINKLANEANIEYTDKDVFLASMQNDLIVDFLCYKQIDNRYSVIFISDKSNDFQIIFGLVKTLLFLADLAAKECVTLPKYCERVAKAIGFTLTDDYFEMKLADYQSKCGGCCS